MTFVGVIDREHTSIVDGFSSAKTVKGAIADMGRYITKHLNKREGEGIIENKEDALFPAKDSEGGYYLEVEEVPCASQYNEDTDEVEYKEGYNFYVCCRFVK